MSSLCAAHSFADQSQAETDYGGLSHDPEYPCRGSCALSTSTIGCDHERNQAAQRCSNEGQCARALELGDDQLSFLAACSITLTEVAAVRHAFANRMDDYLQLRGTGRSHEIAWQLVQSKWDIKKFLANEAQDDACLARERDQDDARRARKGYAILTLRPERPVRAWRQFAEMPTTGQARCSATLMWDAAELPAEALNCLMIESDDDADYSADQRIGYAPPQPNRPAIQLSEYGAWKEVDLLADNSLVYPRKSKLRTFIPAAEQTAALFG